MTFRAIRGSRPGTTRRGLTVGAVAAVGFLAAGCSAVTPAQNGSGASGSASASGSSDADTFGTPASADQVKNGGTLVMALSAEPDQLDPTLSRSLYSRYVFHAMCEKLYDVDQSAKIVPQLATGLPTVSDGGKTVTIPVREGVKFADGTPFDAAAVKTTFERDLTLDGSGRKSELGPVTSVEAPDAKTVVVKLKTPFAPLTAALADRAGMILSPKATKALGKNFATAPVCVGPFKFAKRVPQNSHRAGQGPELLRRRPRSTSTRSPTGSSPTPPSASANLRSGDVQVADSLSAQDVPALKKESYADRPAVGVARLPGHHLQRRQHQRCRHAGGHARPPGGQGHRGSARRSSTPRPGRPGQGRLQRPQHRGLLADRAAERVQHLRRCRSARAHDPAKAKQLLSEAGVTTPFPITMITSNNPDSLRLAQALQSMVKEGGFDLKIKPMEFATLLDQQDRGDFELLQLGWSGRVDPDGNITNFVGTGGSQNVAGYNDKAMDALLTKARESQDLAQRKQLYAQAVDEAAPGRPADLPVPAAQPDRCVQHGQGRPGLPGRRDPGWLRRLREVRRTCGGTCSTVPGSRP